MMEIFAILMLAASSFMCGYSSSSGPFASAWIFGLSAISSLILALGVSV